jgi:hypothetical protein
MNKILIPKYSSGAGKWIYNGFASAWEAKGYEVERWNTIGFNSSTSGTSLMIACHNILAQTEKELCETVNWLKIFDRVYLFATSNNFPEPWGVHENYSSRLAKNLKFVDIIKNKLNNVHFWTFFRVDARPEFWSGWGEVKYLPLAFDSLNYSHKYDERYTSDVCFVGGWADNGFNTKKQILKDWLGAFRETDLKCRFMINQNISHEEEEKILSSAKVCVNIHDDYQHELGLDTNERTFKTLGLNGCLVSDYVGELERLDLGAQLAKSPTGMTILAQTPCSDELRERNRKNILENHTYINRVEEILSWG